MDIIKMLEEGLPAGRVVVTEDDRQAHAHDYWALEAIRDLGGTPAAGPLCVVYPESTEEVSKALQLASQSGCWRRQILFSNQTFTMISENGWTVGKVNVDDMEDMTGV